MGRSSPRGRDRISIQQDNRTYVELKTVIEKADGAALRSGRERQRRGGDQRVEIADDDTLVIIVGSVACLTVIVALYLQYQHEVRTVVTWLAIFAISFCLSALTWARLKRVRLQPLLALAYISTALLAVIVFVDLYFLENPSYSGNYRDVLELGKTKGFWVLLERYGFDAAMFIAYQILGLLMGVVLLALVLLSSARLLAIVNVAISARWGTAWNRLVRETPPFGRVLAAAVLCAVVSVAFTSGWVYNALPRDLRPPTNPSHVTSTPKPQTGNKSAHPATTSPARRSGAPVQ